MPQTSRSYPLREIALRVEDRSPINGNERSQAGDIIAIREPLKGVGSAEVSEYLWLRIEGPDQSVLDQLDSVMEPETELNPIERFEKRRFSIPLDRLPAATNLTRVRDVTDAYQPFLPLDEDNNRFLEGAEARSLDVTGLVFDKLTGSYL